MSFFDSFNRDEIMNWINFGLGLMDLIPGGVVAFQAILSLFPNEIQQEYTPEKVTEVITEQRRIRAENDAARNERRTEEPPAPTE